MLSLLFSQLFELLLLVQKLLYSSFLFFLLQCCGNLAFDPFLLEQLNLLVNIERLDVEQGAVLFAYQSLHLAWELQHFDLEIPELAQQLFVLIRLRGCSLDLLQLSDYEGVQQLDLICDFVLNFQSPELSFVVAPLELHITRLLNV